MRGINKEFTVGQIVYVWHVLSSSRQNLILSMRVTSVSKNIILGEYLNCNFNKGTTGRMIDGVFHTFEEAKLDMVTSRIKSIASLKEEIEFIMTLEEK